MQTIGRWAALLLFTTSLAAAAQDRIAIVPFQGKGAEKVRAQVSKALCQSSTCVKPGRGGKKVSVDGVITGKVKGSGARRSLELSVYTTDEDTVVQRRLPLDRKGLLSKRALATAVATVKTSLATAATDGEEEEGDELPSLTSASGRSPRG